MTVCGRSGVSVRCSCVELSGGLRVLSLHLTPELISKEHQYFAVFVESHPLVPPQFADDDLKDPVWLGSFNIFGGSSFTTKNTGHKFT